MPHAITFASLGFALIVLIPRLWRDLRRALVIGALLRKERAVAPLVYSWRVLEPRLPAPPVAKRWAPAALAECLPATPPRAIRARRPLPGLPALPSAPAPVRTAPRRERELHAG